MVIKFLDEMADDDIHIVETSNEEGVTALGHDNLKNLKC